MLTWRVARRGLTNCCECERSSFTLWLMKAFLKRLKMELAVSRTPCACTLHWHLVLGRFHTVLPTCLHLAMSLCVHYNYDGDNWKHARNSTSGSRKVLRKAYPCCRDGALPAK